jgi:o-succinylbenzoate synthase
MGVARRVLRNRGRLSAPVANARSEWHEREGLMLEIRDEKGRLGQGEASPLPGYSRESLDECLVALAGSRKLSGGAGLPAAASAAIDAAVLDLRGHQLWVPSHSLLVDGRCPAVPLSAAIPTDDLERALAETDAALSRGIRTLKLKIGRPGAFQDELGTARAIRRIAGAAIALRFDANGAFTIGEARERLSALAELQPELVEEPVADGRLDGLEDTPVPLAIDESLHFPDRRAAVDAALKRGLIKAVVLKPMLLGGATRCLELADRMAGYGVAFVVTHTWDGPIALALGATLALTLATKYPGRVLACGLDRHPGLSAWPNVALPFLRPDRIAPNELPGLGLESPLLLS